MRLTIVMHGESTYETIKSTNMKFSAAWIFFAVTSEAFFRSCGYSLPELKGTTVDPATIDDSSPAGYGPGASVEGD